MEGEYVSIQYAGKIHAVQHVDTGHFKNNELKWHHQSMSFLMTIQMQWMDIVRPSWIKQMEERYRKDRLDYEKMEKKEVTFRPRSDKIVSSRFLTGARCEDNKWGWHRISLWWNHNRQRICPTTMKDETRRWYRRWNIWQFRRLNDIHTV